MSKRIYLIISTAITLLMTVLFGIIFLSALFGGSADPDLGEAIGRVLIMIISLIALIYLGINLLVKGVGILVQHNIYTVFMLVLDILGVVILAALFLSSCIEADADATLKDVFIDGLPVLFLALGQIAAIVFDAISFRAKKRTKAAPDESTTL